MQKNKTNSRNIRAAKNTLPTVMTVMAAEERAEPSPDVPSASKVMAKEELIADMLLSDDCDIVMLDKLTVASVLASVPELELSLSAALLMGAPCLLLLHFGGELGIQALDLRCNSNLLCATSSTAGLKLPDSIPAVKVVKVIFHKHNN